MSVGLNKIKFFSILAISPLATVTDESVLVVFIMRVAGISREFHISRSLFSKKSYEIVRLCI